MGALPPSFHCTTTALPPGPVLAVSSQRNALLLLAASIDTTGVLNWSVNTAMCSWTGVTCNAAGSVTTV